MLKLFSALALLFASTQIASATPTRFYVNGILGNGPDHVYGLIVIDPTTGIVQPGTIALTIGGFAPLGIPDSTYNLSLSSITSTTATSAPGLGSVNGITELLYSDPSGSYVGVDISADSGSLIGYTGGNLCVIQSLANCRSFTDYAVSFATGPEVIGGPYTFTSGSLTSTPEPSSVALLGTGLLSACAAARRRWLR